MSADEILPHQMQLENFKASQQKVATLTTSNGAPIAIKDTVLTVGPRGPMLLQDVVFLDELAHFDRERIPERVVHAKGAGAHGYFEVTDDITKYCKAAIFNKVGKQTPLFVRFSTVGGEMGSADTVRDPRGFAVKFYTEEGNWDLVGNNTPIFFIRDPILFPNFIHTQKRNPVTHLKDPNMAWDFFSLRPETTHQVMILYSDRGIPDGFRHMNGYGSHTFKMVNAKGEAVYCKFHFKTEQGIRNISADKAQLLAGSDPDYSLRDLYDSIENGKYPSWKLYIQVMTFEQSAKCPFNPFDVTKVWPHKDYPLIPVGKMVLNRNPSNYFAEVEQSAFSPAHVVPGIEFSPDKMLQGRLFSYTDTQFYRLGTNYVQIPVNCPYRTTVANVQRDGSMTVNGNQGGMPNYHPNSFNGAVERTDAKDSKWEASGLADRFDAKDDDNYSQSTELWTKVLDQGGRSRLVENIVNDLKVCNSAIQERAIQNFMHVHADLGNGIRSGIEKWRQEHPQKKAFNPKENVMQPCPSDRMAKITDIAKYSQY